MSIPGTFERLAEKFSLQVKCQKAAAQKGLKG
jgi:hypothetical protein